MGIYDAEFTSRESTSPDRPILEVTYTPPPPPVGGVWVPIDKLGLLAPYLGLVSVIVCAVAVSGVVVKHKRKQRN